MLQHLTKIRVIIILAVAMMTSCVAGEYNAPSHMRVMSDNSANQSYQVTTSTEVARIGETSQRFEIRHGDCGKHDCNNDRRRIEVVESNGDLEAHPGQQRWYGWSIYLAGDFRDLGDTNTTLGQVKLNDWREPIWNFNAREGGRLDFEYKPGGNHRGIECRGVAAISQMRGRWTDIVIFSDFSYEISPGQPSVSVWINGRLVCSGRTPLITREMVDYANNTQITLRYGIYNSYISRWLNANRTLPVNTEQFVDGHDGSGGNITSAAQRPFDIDWGVTLPTQVVYYDEVRIGDSREEVDVRMRHPN